MVWLQEPSRKNHFNMKHPVKIFLDYKKFFRQIGVGHQTVSLLWTARAAGDSTGYLLSGTTFGSSWMDSSRQGVPNVREFSASRHFFKTNVTQSVAEFKLYSQKTQNCGHFLSNLVN